MSFVEHYLGIMATSIKELENAMCVLIGYLEAGKIAEVAV